jgi:hypothetical protein
VGQLKAAFLQDEKVVEKSFLSNAASGMVVAKS